MKKISVILLLFFSIVGLIACERGEHQPDLFQEQMFVMGTMVNVTFADVEDKKSQKVFHDLLTDFKYMHAAWSPSKRGSLRRVNGLLKLESPFSMGPGIRELIIQSTELSKKSDYLFNPAIGELIKLWGFQKDELPQGKPPSDEDIKKIVNANLRMEDLIIDGLFLSTKKKNFSLDFGGFAKGVAVDKAIEYLKSMGVNNAIINAGGDLRAIGKKGSKPWRIGIQHPREKSIIASIDIQGDEAVFTSGDYERFFEYNGVRFHHILDPRNGYPATETTSVTVIHNNAATADAASTALFVAGPTNWEKIAKKMGVDQVMLIDKNGKIYLTPKMRQRIEIKNEQAQEIITTKHF